MSELFSKKDYKIRLQGLCCVEVSGESCANCLTLMPVLQSLIDARGDIRLVCERIFRRRNSWKNGGLRVPTVL
ncbi:MAG: hypothetical protein ACLRSW_11260 [Christensenellaceae bacterium]